VFAFFILVSISPTFYEQLLCQNPFAKKLQIQIVSTEKLRKKTFKLLLFFFFILVSISPKFYEQLLRQNLFAKKLQTQIVSTEKLCIKLLYEKAARKILAKLTPSLTFVDPLPVLGETFCCVWAHPK
jgi:hypothetical protein